MNFTAKELDNAIDEAWWEKVGEDSDRADYFMETWYEGVSDEEKITTPYGDIQHIDSWGGEGDGAEIHLVIKVADRYFQKDGYYSSWGEDTMDGDLYEVKSKQVQRTEYEAI